MQFPRKAYSFMYSDVTDSDVDGVTFFNRKDLADCSSNGDEEAGQTRPHHLGKRKNQMGRVGCK
jgi:hypothetical protein